MLDDLPPLQDGAAAWTGPEMAARGDWIDRLSQAEVAEVEAAAAPLVARQADMAAMTAQDFVLPTLAPRLARLRAEVLNGRGFALLRGLPVQRWPLRLSATAFFGIGTHLGAALSQNAQGHVLGHVQDLGLRSDDPRVRIYQTADRQSFHTDSADRSPVFGVPRGSISNTCYDGVNWVPVTTNGMGNPYNMGLRTLVSTPHGMFIGTANPFGPKIMPLGGDRYVPNPRGGCEVFLASSDA